MESAGTPTELPSPTPLAAEAWPATAAAAAGMAGGAGIAGRGCRHPCSNPRAVLAVDFPDLEFTTHNQEAHEANTKLASELKASIENKLIEIGIWNFWNTPNLANDSARTQWQYMMKLPALSIAVASKQCKQGWMRSAQESAEKLSEEMQLVTWRAAASRLFTVADPLSLAGEGHQASLQLPHEVTQSNASCSAVAVANPSGQALMCAAVLATSVPLIEVRDEEMDGKAACNTRKPSRSEA